MKLLASFGGLVKRNGGVCVVLGLSYAKQMFWNPLGAWLHDLKVFVSYGGLVMRTKGVGIVWGLDYTKPGRLRQSGADLCETWLKVVSWGLGYAKRSCLLHFRA
jgi:hypothetical protein